MACCGRKDVTIPQDQQKILDAVKKQQQPSSSGAKSNRSPAGTIAKQCPNCGAKTIVPVCPICSFKLR